MQAGSVLEFPWWTPYQRELSMQLSEFVDQHYAEALIYRKRREIPWNIIREVGNRGWFGFAIPEEYGGQAEKGAAVCSVIVGEELSRLPGVHNVYLATLSGGVDQICLFGTPEQKQRFLPKLAKAEIIGAIVITEPFVGSDAASIRLEARREGDEYVLNGKKRYIVNGGIADIYMVYARTSNDPKDIASRRHLTAFIVEADVEGLRVERITELCGWDNICNAYLDFDEVRVPIDNRIGNEGDGWKVMTTGLNFERLVGASTTLGQIREAIRYAIFHTQRRVQFGMRTGDHQLNQLRISDLIMKYQLARLATHYSAYLMDLGKDPVLEVTLAKIFSTDSLADIAANAVLCMGGDGWSGLYPVEGIFRDSKILQIGAGTNDILRLFLYRYALRSYANLFKPPMHKDRTLTLNVDWEPRKIPEPELNRAILDVLASDYIVNPGLFMSLDDMKVYIQADPQALRKAIQELEREGMVEVHRERGEIALVKATYKGLRKAHSLEYYKHVPDWVKPEQFKFKLRFP